MKSFIAPYKWFLIYLFQGGARVYRMHSNGLRLIRVFSADQAGYNAYQEWAQLYAKKPVMVLVESNDQVIQNEKIPYVLGLDRLALIQRKISQLIPGQPEDKTLAHFVSCGRSTEGEKQESLLLLGLADSQVWLPWLLPLRYANMRIGAVTTPSLVCASIAQQIGRSPGVTLQISWNIGGIIQTLLDKGEPLLARFCGWPDGASSATAWHPDVMLEVCIEQTQKLLGYLQGRGLWSQSLRIPITVVLPASLANHALTRPEAWPDLKGVTWRLVVAPSHQEKLSKASSQSVFYGAETLPLQQLVMLKKVIQLAPNLLRFRYLQWRYMKIMWRVVWLVVFLFLALAATYGGQFLMRYWENEKLLQSQELVKQQYESKRALFPKIGISHENLRDTIAYSKALEECYPGFPRLLFEMSQVGLQHPLIELTGIAWDQSLKVDKKNPYERTLQCMRNFILSGMVISDKTSTQRSIQNTFEDWKEAIRDLGVANIEVEKQPLNLSKGKYTETSPAPSKSPFEIKITLFHPVIKDEKNKEAEKH